MTSSMADIERLILDLRSAEGIDAPEEFARRFKELLGWDLEDLSDAAVNPKSRAAFVAQYRGSNLNRSIAIVMKETGLDVVGRDAKKKEFNMSTAIDAQAPDRKNTRRYLIIVGMFANEDLACQIRKTAVDNFKMSNFEAKPEPVRELLALFREQGLIHTDSVHPLVQESFEKPKLRAYAEGRILTARTDFGNAVRGLQAGFFDAFLVYPGASTTKSDTPETTTGITWAHENRFGGGSIRGGNGQEEGFFRSTDYGHFPPDDFYIMGLIGRDADSPHVPSHLKPAKPSAYKDLTEKSGCLPPCLKGQAERDLDTLCYYSVESGLDPEGRDKIHQLIKGEQEVIYSSSLHGTDPLEKTGQPKHNEPMTSVADNKQLMKPALLTRFRSLHIAAADWRFNGSGGKILRDFFCERCPLLSQGHFVLYKENNEAGNTKPCLLYEQNDAAHGKFINVRPWAELVEEFKVLATSQIDPLRVNQVWQELRNFSNTYGETVPERHKKAWELVQPEVDTTSPATIDLDYKRALKLYKNVPTAGVEFRKHIRAMFRTLLVEGRETAILGAFACGAFACSAHFVAEIFWEVMKKPVKELDWDGSQVGKQFTWNDPVFKDADVQQRLAKLSKEESTVRDNFKCLVFAITGPPADKNFEIFRDRFQELEDADKKLVERSSGKQTVREILRSHLERVYGTPCYVPKGDLAHVLERVTGQPSEVTTALRSFLGSDQNKIDLDRFLDWLFADNSQA